jgi:hypothetical protein
MATRAAPDPPYAEQPRFRPHGLPAAPGVARPDVSRSRSHFAPESSRHLARRHREHLPARLALPVHAAEPLGADARELPGLHHPVRGPSAPARLDAGAAIRGAP